MKTRIKKYQRNDKTLYQAQKSIGTFFFRWWVYLIPLLINQLLFICELIYGEKWICIGVETDDLDNAKARIDYEIQKEIEENTTTYINYP